MLFPSTVIFGIAGLSFVSARPNPVAQGNNVIYITKVVQYTEGGPTPGSQPQGGQFEEYAVNNPPNNVVVVQPSHTPQPKSGTGGQEEKLATGGTGSQGTGSQGTGSQGTGGNGGGNGGTQSSSCSSLGQQPSYSADTKTQALYWTNMHRCNHSNTAPVTWDDDLASKAQDCVSKCTTYDPKNPEAVHCLEGANAQNWALTTGQPIWPKSFNEWYYGPTEWGILFDSSDHLRADWQSQNDTHIRNMIDQTYGTTGCASAQCSDGLRTVCNLNLASPKVADNIGAPLGHADLSQDTFSS